MRVSYADVSEKFMLYAAIFFVGGALLGTQLFVLSLAWRVARLEYACRP